MTQINIMKLITPEYPARTDLIIPDYPLQFPRMRSVYLVVDWDFKTVAIESRNYTIDGTPIGEWIGRIWTFKLPSLIDAVEICGFITEEILPRLEQIEAQYDTKWDGHNWVPDWKGSKHERIRERVAELLEDAPLLDHGGLYSAEDWYQLEHPGVTADTTDFELEEMIPLLEIDAAMDNVILEGLKEYLYNLRDEKRYEEN